MDREEAIKILEHERDADVFVSDYRNRVHEALDLAIEALGRTDTDCISRQQAIEAIADIEVINHDQLNIREGAVFMLEQLPPVNQKQVTGKLETAENATSEGEESTMNQPKSKLDLISRQEVLGYIDRLAGSGLGKNKSLDYIRKYISALPPVIPTERKEPICEHYYKGYCSRFEDGCFWQCRTERTGEWIPCTKGGLPLTELGRKERQKWYGYKCSKCNFIYKGNALTESPFCQNCGVKMKG